MLSLALVVALGGLTRAAYDSITTWLNVALNPDLFVTTSESLTSRSFQFPGSMESELRAIPGIQEVQAVRDARFPVRGVPIVYVATDVKKLLERERMPPLAGDPEKMYRL